jgi:hypothetical protein
MNLKQSNAVFCFSLEIAAGIVKGIAGVSHG